MILPLTPKVKNCFHVVCELAQVTQGCESKQNVFAGLSYYTMSFLLDFWYKCHNKIISLIWFLPKEEGKLKGKCSYVIICFNCFFFICFSDLLGNKTGGLPTKKVTFIYSFNKYFCPKSVFEWNFSQNLEYFPKMESKGKNYRHSMVYPCWGSILVKSDFSVKE